MNPFTMTTPCGHCPFRTDVDFPLRPTRAREFVEDVDPFHCHRTRPDLGHEGPERYCAGLLILREKIGEPSQMMRFGERLGLYDRTKLDMDAPVYDSVEEMEADAPQS